MSAAAYRAQCYTRIADLLGTWAPFYTAMRSAFRFDQQMDAAGPTASVADGLYPRWVLTSGVQTGYRMWDVAPAFSDNVIPYDPTVGHLEQFTQPYLLSIVHDTGNGRYEQNRAQIEEDAVTAIRQGGPRLNLPFVRCLDRIYGRSEFAVGPLTSGAERWTTTIVIPVRMEFQGATLLV